MYAWQLLMLIGTADVLAAPSEKPVFIEDLAPEAMQVQISNAPSKMYSADCSSLAVKPFVCFIFSFFFSILSRGRQQVQMRV